MKTQEQTTTDQELNDILLDATEEHVPASEVQFRADNAISIITVMQAQTKKARVPSGCTHGMFYSPNTAMNAASSLYVVLYKEDDTKLLFDKLGDGAKPCCACPKQIDGVGYPFEMIDGVSRQNFDKPRLCAYCPHSLFRANDKNAQMEKPLQTTEKCKGKMTLTAAVLEDIYNISRSTVFGAKLQFGSGSFSPDYAKYRGADMQWQSWPAMAATLAKAVDKNGHPRPLAWDTIIFEMKTMEFSFKVGSAFMPIFRAVRGRGVYEPMKQLTSAFMPQLALMSAVDVAALTGEVDDAQPYAPTMTGSPSVV